jgi:hypothetical protein
MRKFLVFVMLILENSILWHVKCNKLIAYLIKIRNNILLNEMKVWISISDKLIHELQIIKQINQCTICLVK